MIFIGLERSEKQKKLSEYLQNNNIRKVFIISTEKKEYDTGNVEKERLDWSDVIMYKYFYRLLEEIDPKCLIVIDEMMRTQNRSELTYNCAHHYLNQTPHRLIFEYFPFIEQKDDFLILLDFQDKPKYRGKGFEWGMLKEQDIRVKKAEMKFEILPVPISAEEKAEYFQKKETLFAELGSKNPDTIPRNLHVFVGKYKKRNLYSGKIYVARNSRFNMLNVITYKNQSTVSAIIIDFPHRRIDFNDYLKRVTPPMVSFLHTGLPVDNYYAESFRKWLERLEEFYDQASISE